MWLGVDTGGTFTDFVLYDGARLRVHKVLSTPHAPEQAILQGIAELGLDPRGLHLVHGSTVATNAVLEGKGVRTAYITNRGFKDVLTIGRQARRDLYDLQPQPTTPPVSAQLCLETGGRLGADGTLVEALTEADLQTLRERLLELQPDAVAINLLFSFLDSSYEERVAAVVPPGTFISRSSAVLPEYREYERGITTWLNAWIGPLVANYVARLTQALRGARIAVMQSSGDTIAAEHAGEQAVRMLLSGPAGGLAGAGFIGNIAQRAQLLTFDMGGTSTDVALIDGDIRLTSEGTIGDYPVAVPMVDMHTIGAGGGSIAFVDEGGLLQVGPRSAGAHPGPACYGRGGTEATVTDANLLLGRLRADAFLGGAMRLDENAAHAAIARLAARLGLGMHETAQGIVQIADEHMAQALRVISVQRGLDPSDYTLTSFGGAGGLHVCALADALRMRRALVPLHAGVLSALGMLAAPRGRRLSRAFVRAVDETSDAQFDAALRDLELQGRAALREEGVADDEIDVEYGADVRYRGQSYSLYIPGRPLARIAGDFHDAHERRYGHRLARDVELVNARIAVRGRLAAPLALQPWQADGREAHAGTAQLHGIAATADVYRRESLSAGAHLNGPALIVERVATTYLAPGWTAHVDAYGNLLLTK